MKSKTEQVRKLLEAGNLKGALTIVVTFRFGFTPSERRTLQIAKECLNGHSKFYADLGIDWEREIIKTGTILKKIYRNNDILAQSV